MFSHLHPSRRQPVCGRDAGASGGSRHLRDLWPDNDKYVNGSSFVLGVYIETKRATVSYPIDTDPYVVLFYTIVFLFYLDIGKTAVNLLNLFDFWKENYILRKIFFLKF